MMCSQKTPESTVYSCDCKRGWPQNKNLLRAAIKTSSTLRKRTILSILWVNVQYNLKSQIAKCLICRIAFKKMHSKPSIAKIRFFIFVGHFTLLGEKVGRGGPVAENQDTHWLRLPVEVRIKKDVKEVPLDGQNHIKIATYEDYIVLQVYLRMLQSWVQFTSIFELFDANVFLLSLRISPKWAVATEATIISSCSTRAARRRRSSGWRCSHPLQRPTGHSACLTSRRTSAAFRGGRRATTAARVNHYVMQHKEIGCDRDYWLTVASACKDTTFVCQGFKESKEYNTCLAFAVINYKGTSASVWRLRTMFSPKCIWVRMECFIGYLSNTRYTVLV